MIKKGSDFFQMQNFVPFLIFIIHQMINSKFDAFLQPVLLFYNLRKPLSRLTCDFLVIIDKVWVDTTRISL